MARTAIASPPFPFIGLIRRCRGPAAGGAARRRRRGRAARDVPGRVAGRGPLPAGPAEARRGAGCGGSPAGRRPCCCAAAGPPRGAACRCSGRGGRHGGCGRLARADLDQAVAALGPAGGPEREVWRLLYVEDRPVAEVAELMGIPAGTVKSRAHRARRLLRRALGDGPVAEGDAMSRIRADYLPDGRPTLTWTGSGSGWRRRCGAGRRAGWNGWLGGCCARRGWPGRW